MKQVWQNEITHLKGEEIVWRENFLYATESLARRDLMRIRTINKHQTDCRIVYFGPRAVEVYENEHETPAFNEHFLKKN